jgi:phosphohistidine phosphatase
MELYLVRHAVAFDEDPSIWPDDAARPLTKQGEKRFKRSARGLRTLAPKVDVLLSSPFTRAWRTAEILAKEAGWPDPQRCDALAVSESLENVISALREQSAANGMALVGHAPSLDLLAAHLLVGQSAGAVFELKKGGVTRLQIEANIEPGSAALRWLLTPKQLRALC